MDPADEGKAPVGGVETDDPWPEGVEVDRQGEQALGEGGIVGIGRPEQKQDG